MLALSIAIGVPACISEGCHSNAFDATDQNNPLPFMLTCSVFFFLSPWMSVFIAFPFGAAGSLAVHSKSHLAVTPKHERNSDPMSM